MTYALARAEQSTGISLVDYHAAPYLSSSKIGDYAKRGPRYFAMRHVQRASMPPPSTKAQIFGQAFEDLVCEPMEIFRDRYAIKPADMTFQTKEGKAWGKAQVAAGKLIISSSEHADLHAMRESLWENEMACSLMRSSQGQQQLTMRAPYGGTPGVQSRPDFFSTGCAVTELRPFVMDLKTSIHFSRMQNGRAVADYRYHVQASLAHYCYAERARPGAWLKEAWRPDLESFLLVVEKCSPYRCQLLAFTPAWIEAGWAWAQAQLNKLARHYATNTWPRTEQECLQLPAPPAWIDVGVGGEEEEEEEAA